MHDFASHIERWYCENGRELPWRQTTDPYRIWISEIILQQTRVAQGYAYYQRFIERFPTVEALAFASVDEVMQSWEGLGYYSRARNLHAASRQIVEMGQFPNDYQSIRELKGVGDYTAAAIASFGFGLPHAVVDGNVYRVLSRYFAIDTPIDSTAGKRSFALLAQELLDECHPALYNQAIMDFGALQCTPKSPNCLCCPLSDSCLAYAQGAVERLPIKGKKTVVKDRYFTYLIILDECPGAFDKCLDTSDEIAVTSNESAVLHRGFTYIHRRGEGDIWNGLYEPLLVETPSKIESSDVIAEDCHIIGVIEGIKHQLTHRTIHADAYLIRVNTGRSGVGYAKGLCQQKKGNVCDIALSDDYIRVPIANLHQYAAPRLVNIIYSRLLNI